MPAACKQDIAQVMHERDGQMSSDEEGQYDSISTLVTISDVYTASCTMVYPQVVQ